MSAVPKSLIRLGLGIAVLWWCHDKLAGFYGLNINQGITGGIKVPEWLVGVALVGMVGWYLRRRVTDWRWEMILVGGGVNMIDRVVWGGVRDYWSLPYGWHNNINDWVIFIGLLGIIVYDRMGR